MQKVITSNFRRGLRMNKFDVIKKYIDEFDYYGLLASINVFN